MRKVIVGTRQSVLALTQTGQVIDQLKEISLQLGLECEFILKKIVTKGDQILDVTLSKVGGKGLFVKEIEQALLDGEIDMAVHSMKDMPWEIPHGLVIGAIPEREDARDCLVTRGGLTLDELPVHAKIGTSSLRRMSQLKHYRPDLRMESIRGNIDSRLRKLETEGFDAIVLAAAGMHRIGWADRISSYLMPDVCVPAVGQGALGIECRAGDAWTLSLLSRLNHTASALAVAAERSFLGSLHGGCQVPLGAHAVLCAQAPEAGDGRRDNQTIGLVVPAAPALALSGVVGTPDGLTVIREAMTGTDPAALGAAVAEALLARGAARILAEAAE